MLNSAGFRHMRAVHMTGLEEGGSGAVVVAGDDDAAAAAAAAFGFHTDVV